MINTRLFNIHDIVLIAAIAVIVHIVAKPLFDRIGGSSSAAPAS